MKCRNSKCNKEFNSLVTNPVFGLCPTCKDRYMERRIVRSGLKENELIAQSSTSAMGWTELFVKPKSLKPDKLSMLSIKGTISTESFIDLRLFLIPKFRGIHYQNDPASRFYSSEEYEKHKKSRQTRRPTLSPAVYDLADSHRRPRPDGYLYSDKEKLQELRKKNIDVDHLLKQSKKLNTKLQKKFGTNEKFVFPPLASDITQFEVDRRKKQLAGTTIRINRQQPKNQKTAYEQEQQIYVNTFGTYKKVRDQTLSGITQISTSDSPYHAALYALGEKFTTQAQQEQKKAKKPSVSQSNDEKFSKKRKADKIEPQMFGGRRLEGVVGKVYTYLFSPSELQSLNPAVVPEMQENREIAIKPLQRWELETTFYGDIPGQYLIDETSVSIPDIHLSAYKTFGESDGRNIRQKVAKELQDYLWEKAKEVAIRRGKILISHGEFSKLKKRLPILPGDFEKILKMCQSINLKKFDRLQYPRSNDPSSIDNFNRVPVTGDGNCLFRSILVAIRLNSDEHLALRRNAVAHMRDYIPMFGNIFYREKNNFSFMEYLEQMDDEAYGPADRGRWGGALEIYALSRLLRRRIIIHSVDNPEGYPIYEIQDSNFTPNGEPDIHIYFVNNNHYDALLLNDPNA